MIFIFTTNTEKYAMKSGSFCYYKSGKGMLQIGTIATNLKPEACNFIKKETLAHGTGVFL